LEAIFCFADHLAADLFQMMANNSAGDRRIVDNEGFD